MPRKLRFIIITPKNMQVSHLSQLDDKIVVEVHEGFRRIDTLDLGTAKVKYPDIKNHV